MLSLHPSRPAFPQLTHVCCRSCGEIRSLAMAARLHMHDPAWWVIYIPTAAITQYRCEWQIMTSENLLQITFHILCPIYISYKKNTCIYRYVLCHFRRLDIFNYFCLCLGPAGIGFSLKRNNWLRICVKFICSYQNDVFMQIQRVCNSGLWVEVIENTAISNTDLTAC